MISSTLAATPDQAAWKLRVSWWAWLCAAISIALIQTVPTVPAAAFVLVVGLYCVIFPARPLAALSWSPIPWMIVGLAALSALWSPFPMLSARGAAQLGLTTLAALLFARALPPFLYIAVLMYSFLASILYHHFVAPAFGSKNQLALAAALALLSSFWVMVDRQQPKISRLVALLAMVTLPPIFVASNSAGAMIAGIIALLCSAGPYMLRSARASVRYQLIGVAALVVCMAIGIAYIIDDNIIDLALASVGKDTTLTGRTLLWSHALDVIAEHPFGGMGLQAVWAPGDRWAERFWAFFYIYTRNGFHFHNLWLELGAELGLTGIVLGVLTTLLVVFETFRWVLEDPKPESCFFAGYVALAVFRTFAEVELFIAQFYMAPMIFLAAYYYAATARDARAARHSFLAADANMPMLADGALAPPLAVKLRTES
ncbi:O-antigen ligase family protein [Bradyrhizobium sp. HKCCYLS3077]|uniref:O-antigen ligase family protein n=1 Tax=unclassified Bradyrhizobium TaxID=2631580 RepID=UPI003EBB5FEC